MKPSIAAQIIEKMVLNYKPVLLVGMPGIGKTSIIEQVAEKTGSDLMVSHPVVNDPTDAKGFPCVVDNVAQFLPFGDLNYALNYKGERLIWLLDDLGQARPATQAGYMQLILTGRVNGHSLPGTVVFIAATNRREDKAGVSGILEPVKSRFHMIIEIEPDVESFISWGLMTRRIRKEVIACLRLFPELLVSPPSREIKPSANPRVWEFASQCLDTNFPPALIYDSLVSCLGEEAGSQLYGMITVFKNLPSVTSIIKAPGSVEFPTNPSSLHALCIVLAKFLEKKPEKVDQIFTFANRLPGDFSVCLIRDSLALNPALTDTKAFQEWSAKNVGLFI
jgi:hypothetical protein